MGGEFACDLCGRPARYGERDRGDYGSYSPIKCRTCGPYGITEEAAMELRQFDDMERARISAVTRERQISGLPRVIICSSSYAPEERGPADVKVPELVAQFPGRSDVAQRLNRCLLNLAELARFPGDLFMLDDHDYPVCFAENPSVMQYVLRQLAEAGLVELRPTGTGQSAGHITAQGWARVAELHRPGRDSKRVFVAMWFDPSVVPAWEDGMRPAIKEAGYDPIRVDREEHLDKIDDRIVAEIRQSRFVVADFTGHRQGVYFEAGFAMGLGLPVVWACRRDEIEKCHFDTRQYNHIDWSDPEDLRQRLLDRIRANIPAT